MASKAGRTAAGRLKKGYTISKTTGKVVKATGSRKRKSTKRKTSRRRGGFRLFG